jgi:hypothetical protein
MLQQLRQRTILGPFTIAESDGEIRFKTTSGVKPSEEQLLLKSEVERVNAQLKLLFSESEPIFKQYNGSLIGLARVGLTGANAQPGVATRALKSLKDEVLLREGARVKNAYMKALGIAAIWSGAAGIFVWVCSTAIERDSGSLQPDFVAAAKMLTKFAPLWIGCMCGVWLSFGTRKAILSFEDLTNIEDDLLQPSLRVIYAGLLTLVLGAFFLLQVVTVSVGQVSTALVGSDNYLATLMLGALCGISERVLASKVVKQAESFLNFKQ